MDTKQALKWGKDHSFPFLVLSKDQVVKHGEVAWQSLVRSNDVERKALLYARIQQWEERINRSA